MPPVVNTPEKRPSEGGDGHNSSSSGSSSDRHRHPRHGERRPDLLCRVKWNNALPDIPFDPKFIVYPFDSDRFTKYKPTTLEKEYKHELLTEYDLGVMIDLINPDKYNPPPEHLNLLDPADERLIEDETGGSGFNSSIGLNEKRSKQHNKVVPWLKKTEYISTEFNRYGAAAEHSETKVGYNVSKKYKDDKEKILSMNREEQIEAINRTFDEAKVDIPSVHPSKKGVVPVEILPVFPDFEYWKMPFAQVAFDAEPVCDGDGMSQEKRMSEAIIRGVMDESSGEQFVAYFLPTEETLEKRRRDSENGEEYDPEDEYEYRMTREYTWSVKNKATRGYDHNYFFVFRDGAFHYNELETRVKLTKRRSKNSNTSNSFLVVKHRPMDESELKTQELRQLQLMPNVEEEDEDVDVEEKKEEVKEGKGKDDSSSDDEDRVEKKKKEKGKESKKRKNSTSSESDSSSSGTSTGSSSSDSASSKGGKSSSEDESEDEKEKAKKVKKIAEDIFGSDDEST